MTEHSVRSKFSESILPGDYVRFSPITAEIMLNGQHRVMAIDLPFLVSLDSFLGARFPGRQGKVLYQLGMTWGGQAYRQIESLALAIFPQVRQIKELDIDRFHQLFTNHMAALGWGNFELKRRDDFLFVDLYDSLMVEALRGKASEDRRAYTLCHVYAGFFAGIFGRIANMPLACIEITCTGDGYENCSFLLDNAETVGRIEQRVKEGVAPLEAFQKVKKAIDER